MSKKSKDVRIQREDKTPNVLGTLTFVGLRAADPFLQYGILAHHYGTSLIKNLGGTVQVQHALSSTGYSMVDNLQLSPYRLVLLAMATGCAVKQIIWKIFIGEENMAPSFAGFVGVLNTTFNTANSLFFLNKFTSAAANTGEGPNSPYWPGLSLTIGGGIFVTGLLVELVSEVQRKAFKSKPENKGKPHTSGLFGLARHINYTGYTLWRTGYAIAAGGFIWGGLIFALCFYDFASRAVPDLNEYCQQRYADMWHDYTRKTPYVLIPGIY